MRAPPPYFEAARQAAAEYWATLASNRQLMAPIDLLFKQLQNPRHVISELLQNADDTGATEATVDVEDAIKRCFDRSADFVSAYVAENFRLMPADDDRLVHPSGEALVRRTRALSAGNAA